MASKTLVFWVTSITFSGSPLSDRLATASIGILIEGSGGVRPVPNSNVRGNLSVGITFPFLSVATTVTRARLAEVVSVSLPFVGLGSVACAKLTSGTAVQTPRRQETVAEQRYNDCHSYMRVPD